MYEKFFSKQLIFMYKNKLVILEQVFQFSPFKLFVMEFIQSYL